MKKIVKIVVIFSVVQSSYSFGIEQRGSVAEPTTQPRTTEKPTSKTWWSALKDRLGKKTVTPPQEKVPVKTAESTHEDKAEPSYDSKNSSGYKFNQPDLATDSTVRGKAGTTNLSATDLFATGLSAAKDSMTDDLAAKKQNLSDLEKEANEFHESLKEGSQATPKKSRPRKVNHVEASNSDFEVMNRTKNQLFDEFKILKSDKGIQTFKKLNPQHINKRVRKSVDDISAHVGFNQSQETLLEDIIRDNLIAVQAKLKNKLIAQTPEEVARAIFNGAEHDDRWSEFEFSDKQQRDTFENYVMGRAETMKNSSLLETYLRVCSDMTKKAESAASDAHEIGEFSEGSVINKLKIGMHRTRAGVYMAANPCILAVFVLGIVGEFVYGKV